MLFNPFKTTRKMKVPPRARQGHRERSYTWFMNFWVKVCGALILFLILWALFGQ